MSDYSAASQGSLLRPALLMGKTRGNKAASAMPHAKISLLLEKGMLLRLSGVYLAQPPTQTLLTRRERAGERAGGGGIIIYFVR